MPTDRLPLRQVTDADRAAAGHRRMRAEQARHEQLIVDAQLDSARRLAELRTDRPGETNAKVDQHSTAATKAAAKAVALMELAGLADGDLPWSAWFQEFATERLHSAETAYVTAVDEADNPEAYGLDPVQARFTADECHCDVLALQALVDELDAKRAPTPNRAARRARPSAGD